jgi:hypothetical protein
MISLCIPLFEPQEESLFSFGSHVADTGGRLVPVAVRA